MITPDDPGMFYGASPALFEFAKQLRAKETEAEKMVWKHLSKKQLAGFRFRRQHPILYFIADFYCHETRLIVEIDGGIHATPAQYLYDQERDKELIAYGLRVVRFTNEEVITDIATVLEKIEALCYLQTL